jgi:hypothetical protein
VIKHYSNYSNGTQPINGRDITNTAGSRHD